MDSEEENLLEYKMQWGYQGEVEDIRLAVMIEDSLKSRASVRVGRNRDRCQVGLRGGYCS